jgi:antitoxin component of MazEF toxin-antitoxin module
MEIEMGKWGNSAAFRVPAELVRQSGLLVGAKADIQFKDGSIIITPERKKMSRAERYARIIADLEKYGPDEDRVEWGPDVGNEIVE